MKNKILYLASSILILLLLFQFLPVADAQTKSDELTPGKEATTGASRQPEMPEPGCAEKDFRELSYRLEKTASDQIREELKDFYSSCGILDKVDFNEVETPPGKKPNEIDYSITISYTGDSVTSGKGIDGSLKKFLGDKPKDFVAPVIIQKERFLSLNEAIEILEHGAQYYADSKPLSYKGELGESAFLSSVSKKNLDSLIVLDTVKWIGLYFPAYKYSEVPAKKNKPVDIRIEPLGGEAKSYHQDLDELGLQDIKYLEASRAYRAKATRGQFLKVPNLLWVKHVSVLPEEHMAGEEAAEPVEFSERQQNYSLSEVAGEIEQPGAEEPEAKGARNYDKVVDLTRYIVIAGVVVILVVIFWYLYRRRRKLR